MTNAERKIAAKVLQAMGNPIRLGVLEAIREQPKTVNQLVEELSCSQSMMSQQIQKLKHHGLVTSKKVRAYKYCSLRNPDVLSVLNCVYGHLQRTLSQNGVDMEVAQPEQGKGM